MTLPEEPVEARPWREGRWSKADGVDVAAHRPACSVGVPVRHLAVGERAPGSWPRGRIGYQVLIDTDGMTSKSRRTFWWPHEGLRVVRRSTAEPTTEAGRGGDLPRPPRRVKFT
ncbi:hypothetical protein [Streptomyces sp. NPDC127036]|uniref:hypothetical protein n=1 Tax=Streptomyces sp. NPDC127036 TaxID=3347112 RepID=UPI00365E1AAD